MSINIAWDHVLTGIISFALGIVVKTLLDLRLGIWLVRLLWWLPLRTVFRDNPSDLGGQWDATWDSGGSEKFSKDNERHGHPVIRQLGRYCYAQFISKGRTYGFFGKVIGEHWVGEWFDTTDQNGYFGAFQLRIVDSDRLEGMWLGHSKRELSIRSDKFTWTKVLK